MTDKDILAIQTERNGNKEGIRDSFKFGSLMLLTTLDINSAMEIRVLFSSIAARSNTGGRADARHEYS